MSAEMNCGDFEETISRAGAGDLVFADPPYVASEKPMTFRKYHTQQFTWEDQVRLRDCLLEAARRGASVIVLNAETPSVRALYSKGFELDALTVRNTLAANASSRGCRKELLATSWNFA
jgi:DNA adenine methylase